MCTRLFARRRALPQGTLAYRYQNALVQDALAQPRRAAETQSLTRRLRGSRRSICARLRRGPGTPSPRRGCRGRVPPTNETSPEARSQRASRPPTLRRREFDPTPSRLPSPAPPHLAPPPVQQPSPGSPRPRGQTTARTASAPAAPATPPRSGSPDRPPRSSPALLRSVRAGSCPAASALPGACVGRDHSVPSGQAHLGRGSGREGKPLRRVREETA